MTTPVESPLDTPPELAGKRSLWAFAGTFSVHVLLVGLALWSGQRLAAGQAPSLVSQLVEVELPPEPPPAAPPPPPAPPQAAPPPRPSPVVKEKAQPTPPAEPPPAAAEAGQVLAKAEEVVDFGDTFVVGRGSSYAGGNTDANGTSRAAVRDAAARADGVPGGKGTAGASPPTDRSRPPQLAGGFSWDCPFPEEAEDAGVDHATVALKVEVSADGRVTNASVTGPSSFGFGREARRCALSKRWSPGTDRDGKTTSATAFVNVRFDRR